MVKISEGSEVLPYLQVNKLAYHSLPDADSKADTPESDKGHIYICSPRLLCLAALSTPILPPVESDANASMKTNDPLLWIPDCTTYFWTFSSHIMLSGLGWPDDLFLKIHHSIKRLLTFRKISNLLNPTSVKITEPKFWLMQIKIFIYNNYAENCLFLGSKSIIFFGLIASQLKQCWIYQYLDEIFLAKCFL